MPQEIFFLEKAKVNFLYKIENKKVLQSGTGFSCFQKAIYISLKSTERFSNYCGNHFKKHSLEENTVEVSHLFALLIVSKSICRTYFKL